MAENEARDACFDCDCVVSRDRVTSEVDCQACESRAASVEQKGGVEWEWSQEWTNEDEDEDQDNDDYSDYESN